MQRSDEISHTGAHLRYVLITPARNEERYIEQTIQSVIHQTAVPLKWVIVDDGSADRTAAIVEKYLGEYRWMELVQLPKHRDRSFAGKVYAFNSGLERVKGLDYEVVGNIDADVSFDPEYCAFLLGQFENDRRLGVAGTVFEEAGYSSATDSFEGQNHVAGGCQFFRRPCFEGVGGYVPNKAGGIDWIAVTTARMKGWKTRSFREKSFFHYRSLGTAARGLIASSFSYGEKDYYLGGHPVWQLFRTVYRLGKRPYIAGGMAVYAGYLWAFFKRTPRPISDELVRFHRQEQMARLETILRSMFAFRAIDRLKTGSGD
jgi:glycosyltransferase involved in cell wall biosynthesis